MKKCKGGGIANGAGCGLLIIKPFKFGLCKPCYASWLYKTDAGNKYLDKMSLKAKKENSNKISKLYNPYSRRTAKKVEDMDLRELKKATERVCNTYIRMRDRINHGICISSNYEIEHAGHFFSVGSNQALRYSPQNIHGQSVYSNKHKHSDRDNYVIGLKMRYGQSYLDELEELNAETKKIKVLTKDYVLSVNKLYKHLIKKGIWIFKHSEFDELLKQDLK